MKYVFLVSVLLLSACRSPATQSFADRVARAETLEATPSGAIFIGALLKEHGGSINAFTGECYTGSTLAHDSFTLVADINRDGKFENVAVKPETAPSRCYADKMRQLHAKAATLSGLRDASFPIVVNVNYNK